MSKFPFYKQHDAMDCGPTCLKMISKYYGRPFSIQSLRTKTAIGKDGVNLLGICEAAEHIGFRANGVRVSYAQLKNDVQLPCIVHYNQNHFVVLVKISDKSFLRKNEKFVVADPAKGIITLTKEEFLASWEISENEANKIGVALSVQPTPRFYQYTDDETDSGKDTISWVTLFKYVKEEKKFILQLFFGLLIGSILQLIFPFLTQSIVDTGINTQNLNFIYIILLAQFMLFFARTIVDFIRARILLHISTKVNVSLLSDFWLKITKLPLSYFDTKQTGDIIQRINDYHRIESFLTGSALNTMFSIFNIVLFSLVLLRYNTMVFSIFFLGSILYFFWIQFFLKYRRNIDYKRFSIAAKENNATMQLIYGMQEIKLNNAENTYRWAWEKLQASLFKLNFKSLSLNQYQQAGAFFINEGKNIVITFFVAKAVLDGSLTLGAMLAIQYIIGQLNSPVEQLISFSQQALDAKISLERLNEIHSIADEEASINAFSSDAQNISAKNIKLTDCSFTYTGAGNEPVLKQLFLEIPEGKTTAIVGTSGSGKTTILKVLQKFYQTYTGDIKIGHTDLKNISPKYWRSISGSVMQEGYIFSDTIEKNIVVNDEMVDFAKLQQACKTANVLTFIESLPLGFKTKIGAEGNGISAGQRQRILIARVVYKNPQFVFFDEATNALDANNEKVILENLQDFFASKTVIVVAHRLSTVKNADKIVVLENGEIIEEGTHTTLTNKKGKYFELVKNQLELGN